MASLAFPFSLRGTRARAERDPERASEPGRFGPCRRLRVASIAGPSGLPSVTVLVLITGLARAGSRACLLWSLPAPLCGICARPERDPKPVCRRGPGKTSSVFVGVEE